jgi:ribosomal protein L11 methyltransferase
VARDRVEEATALMLELFPEGFAEEARGEAVELAAFTDEAGVDRLRESFGEVVSEPVPADWADKWRRPSSGRVPVVIDPGQAFGTGSHPTTQICLEFLVTLERGSLLDVGCGSGVLAIAAARLGFAPVIAVDSDEAAVEATVRNAEANEVDLDVRHLDACAELLPDTEIALANIDLPTLAELTMPTTTGRLITSGYYEDDTPAIGGFDHVGRRTRAKWAADLFARG